MMSVKTTFSVGPQQEALMRQVRPEAIHAFLKKEGEALLAQVRFNIASGNGLEPLTKKYGMRKDAGKTPGRGRFGSQDILRDTGQMYEALRAIAGIDGTIVTLGLTAEGQRNQELLRWHSFGEGKLPMRDPATHIVMERFQQGFRDRFTKYLAGESMGPGPSAAMALRAG